MAPTLGPLMGDGGAGAGEDERSVSCPVTVTLHNKQQGLFIREGGGNKCYVPTFRNC